MVLKKTILRSGFIALLFSASSVLAQQEKYNKWSIEANFGVNRPFSPYAPGYNTPAIGFFHAGLGTRYMANNKFGMQLGLGLDQISNKKGSTAFTSSYYRASLEGFMNLGNVLGFDEWSDHTSLLFHAGLGYSMLTGKGGGIDDMGHVIVGVAPQFKLNERLSINLDLSLTNNILQSRTFDFTGAASHAGFEGQILTGTVGLSIYLGKNAKHADWYHPVNPFQKELDSLKQVMNTFQEKVNSLEGRVTQVETDLQDSDSDGVADKFDLEPNSAPNAKVDTKGRQTKEVTLGNLSLDTLHGLFFTVQLGVYSHEVPSDVMKNISPLDTKTMPDGKIRYFSGVYPSQEDAAVKLEEAKKAGINDAFITAYYRGYRITLVEARTFLQELGPEILQKR